ncbi:hypothetical protein [Thaumasiovibrio subtropicus]|nr:hypothetical protein [Thaumasiovibrio subtropicus]
MYLPKCILCSEEMATSVEKEGKSPPQKETATCVTVIRLVKAS